MIATFAPPPPPPLAVAMAFITECASTSATPDSEIVPGVVLGVAPAAAPMCASTMPLTFACASTTVAISVGGFGGEGVDAHANVSGIVDKAADRDGDSRGFRLHLDGIGGHG